MNSKFDLGYMQTKSDISAANSMGNWSSDVKAKAFTFGFGVELPTTVGIVNVTPHAGIRYTRLDVEGRDGLFGTDDDKLNVFQAPLGVTFSGAFETSGWNLAPTFDLSVVPAFGDKDATTKYNGLTTEVIPALLTARLCRQPWAFLLRRTPSRSASTTRSVPAATNVRTTRSTPTSATRSNREV